jgi:hypothetical protein
MGLHLVRWASVAVPLVAAACAADGPSAPAEYDLTLRTADPWSGGNLVIITPPVGGGLPVFEVLFDGEPLPTQRVDDTTVSARLPDRPGTHQLSARAPGASVLFRDGVVRLHGYRERVDRPPLKGNLHNFPMGYPRVLGMGPGGPALVDLGTGATVQWADTIGGPECSLGGVGPSWRPDHFALQARTPGAPAWRCTFGAWQILPSPVRAVDAFPTPGTDWQPWAVAEVAPGRWMVTTDDDVFGYDCRSGSCASSLDLRGGGGTWLVLSPLGDRVVMAGQARVVDPATLTVLYTVPGYFWLYDALFFPTGDSLLVIGQEAAGQERMRIVRPADGELLAELDLAGPDGTTLSPTGLALDPGGRWIYVAGEIPVDTLFLPALMVVDRATLQSVALLRTGSDQMFPRFYPYDGLEIVPVPLEGRIYVVWENTFYDPPVWPIGVYVFDRVP